ncbi:DUF748 domain-containing protein [Pseudomonas lini]
MHLADRKAQPEVALELGPLNLDLQNFDSLNGSPFNLKLDTGVGKQGKITADGVVNLAPISAKLNVQTKDIDLRVAQSYINPFIRLELRSGMLGSDLAVDLKSTEPLAFSVTGKAQVDQLHTLDTLKTRDFLKWQQLVLEGLNYQHGDSLSIDKVNLFQPYARFMINDDRTTNIDDLLIPQPADSGTTAAAAKPAAGKRKKPLGIHIGGIAINDGSANFADFSLTPNFATAVQQLNGKIGTIDSRQAKPASVDVKGKVDRYAPVTIKGSVNPFDPMASLDIATSFKRVELTTLTPYSGKFAGYRIRKGRLNLDLHYKITNGQLLAENKVVVEQLQLGEKGRQPGRGEPAAEIGDCLAQGCRRQDFHRAAGERRPEQSTVQCHAYYLADPAQPDRESSRSAIQNDWRAGERRWFGRLGHRGICTGFKRPEQRR